MGHVYQANDTKLNRQVALKILPEAKFATDPDRLARFQREAQVLASLRTSHRSTVSRKPTTPVRWCWSWSRGQRWQILARSNRSR